MNRTRVSAMLLVAALLLPLVWSTAGGAAAQTQPDGGLVESQPVGWNEGKFSVSDDGAAQYAVPLWMPLGRGGVQPELGLSYHSRAGNGLLGVGWSLQGLSRIAPCERNHAQDGVRDGVHFDGSDALCLDGNRLLPLTPTPVPERHYRTERESFSRIIGYGAQDGVPDSFQVWTRDGRILTFGRRDEEPNAQLRAFPLMAGPDPDKPSLVRRSLTRVTVAWQLHKIQDRNGNVAEVQYGAAEGGAADLWSAESWPTAIRYSPNRSVVFHYQERPDPIDGFEGGVHTRTTRRIDRITMHAGPAGGPAELLREYRLGYRDDSISGRSLLSSVTECDHHGTCLMPLQFQWSPGSYQFDTVQTNVTDAGTSPETGGRVSVGDVNGDGRDDLLYPVKDNSAGCEVTPPCTVWVRRISQGDGQFGPRRWTGVPGVGSQYLQDVRPIDVDRDGQVDLVAEIADPTCDCSNHTENYLYRSNGSTYVRYTPDVDGDHRSWFVGFERRDSAYYLDLDGNGLPDYATPRMESQTSAPWRYRLNTGAEGPGRFAPMVHTDWNAGVFGGKTAFVQVLDSDGDGRDEVLELTGNDAYRTIGLNAAGGVEGTAVNLPYTPGQAPDHPFLADVNGDGLDDAVYPFNGLKVQLNSGNGFGPLIPGPAEFTPPVRDGAHSAARTVDFNNDGQDDVLVFHHGTPTGPDDHQRGVQLYVWRAGGFERVALNREAVRLVNLGFVHTQVLDVDGNGALDLVHLEDSDQDGDADRLRLLRRRGTVPDQLTGVQIGQVGPRAEVDYATLAQGGLNLTHVPGACEYPLVCPTRGSSVVAQHRLANGKAGGWNRFVHRYHAARVDASGRGWLGVERHTVIDQQTGRWTWTEFDNQTRDGPTRSYPYAGLAAKTTSTVEADQDTVHRSEVTSTHALRRFGPGSHTVELRTRLDREWEHPAGAPVPATPLRSSTTRFDHDDFGNQTSVVATVANGRRRSEELTYSNDESNWLIGKLTRRLTTGCAGGKLCTTRETTFGYDARGNLERTVVEPGNPELLLRTVIDRTNFGLVSAVRTADAAGTTRVERVGYDGDWLHPTSATNALGHITRMRFHSGLSVPLRSSDPNQVPTTFRHDWFGRIRETIHADGSFERVDYRRGPGSPFITETTFSGAPSRLTELDGLGREAVTRVRAFAGGWSSTYRTYDALGRVVAESRPVLDGGTVHNTTFAYDARDRLLSRRAPDGATVRHEYQGLETHTYNAKGVHSYLVENADGDVASSLEDDPSSTGWLRTRFEHGPFGEPTRTVAPDGTVQTMRYDDLGRRTRHSDPSAGVTVSTYNGFGELVTETDGAGATTRFEHDALGRQTRLTSPDGTAVNTWDTAANGAGQLASARSADGVVTRHSYDTHGRAATTTRTIDGVPYEVGYGYDSAGRLERVTYPRIPEVADRLTVAYAFNASKYLTEARDAAAGGTVYWRAEARAADGQLERERLGNGVLTVRSHQPATGLLQRATSTGPGTVGTLDDLVVTYDPNRNVASRHETVANRRDTYSYDTLDRLTAWRLRHQDSVDATTTYGYDQVGNLTREAVSGQPERDRTYRYGEDGAPPHALTSRNAQRFGYDGAGRQVSGPQRGVQYNRSGLPRVLTWGQDQANRTEFAYDADGARVRKGGAGQTIVSVPGLFERRSPAGTGGTEIHNLHFVVADGRVVAQVNRAQAAGGGPVTVTRVSYLHTDQQASTVLATGATGQPQGEEGSWLRTLFYDPFGRRVDDQGEPLGHTSRGGPRLGYTGHEHDDEFGLINMKGRIYDPELRRFLTPDPLVADPLSSQHLNRYSYVQNNPATRTDPTGFQSVPFGAFGCGLFGGFGPGCGQPQADPGTGERSAEPSAGPDSAPSSGDDQATDPEPIEVPGEVIVIRPHKEPVSFGAVLFYQALDNLYWLTPSNEFWVFYSFEDSPRQTYAQSWQNSRTLSKQIEGFTREQAAKAFAFTALAKPLEMITEVTCTAIRACRLVVDAIDTLENGIDPLSPPTRGPGSGFGRSPGGSRVASNPGRGRFDEAHRTYDDALRGARRNAGQLGDNVEQMLDPKTGTLIGERSADGLRGWRIDHDHVNWWDWSGGKKGSGGRFGHDFFPADQAGPHSRHIGYAPWERRP